MSLDTFNMIMDWTPQHVRIDFSGMAEPCGKSQRNGDAAIRPAGQKNQYESRGPAPEASFWAGICP